MGKESQIAPPKSNSWNQNAKKRSKYKIINFDDGNDVRTANHLVFDIEDDERFVSKIVSPNFFFVPSQMFGGAHAIWTNSP